MALIMLTDAELIAPCGMNCVICRGYLRKDKPCPGRRGDDALKPTYCAGCIIWNCLTIRTNRSGFCYECDRYPCKRLKALDKRYRTKYGMSMLANLQSIKERGLKAFVADERERWRCPGCGGTLCVHVGRCLACGTLRPTTQSDRS